MEAEQLNHITNSLKDLLSREQALRGIFDFDAKSNRLVEVNQILEDPKIWDDPKQAQALGKEKSF